VSRYGRGIAAKVETSRPACFLRTLIEQYTAISWSTARNRGELINQFGIASISWVRGAILNWSSSLRPAMEVRNTTCPSPTGPATYGSVSKLGQTASMKSGSLLNSNGRALTRVLLCYAKLKRSATVERRYIVAI
jgi:hypothetical protein